MCCLVPRRLSFDENVRAKEGGKKTTGETSLRLPFVPFPWSLVVHHQSLMNVLCSFFVSSESVRVRSKVPGHEEALSLLLLENYRGHIY